MSEEAALVPSPDSANNEQTFAEIIALISASRVRALRAVNTALVELYWQIGEIISRKLERAEWGDGVVEDLADFIARTHPGLRGFTRANLFRMRQFYETYRREEKVAPLVRQLPWSHNIVILGQRSDRKNESFTSGWPSRRAGAVGSWSGKCERDCLNEPSYQHQKSRQWCDKPTWTLQECSGTPTCWSFWSCLRVLRKQIYTMRCSQSSSSS